MSTNRSESFGGVTGRDFWIVPRALYIASKALRIAPYFAHSDADDVEAILKAKFPGTIERERMWDWIREAEEMGLGLPPEGAMTPEGIKAWIKAATAPGASVAAAFDRSEPLKDGDWIYYNLDSAESPLHCYARIDEVLGGGADAFVVAYSDAAPSGDGSLIDLNSHMVRITAEEAEAARAKGWPAPGDVIAGWTKAA